MGYVAGDVSASDPVLRDRRQAEGPSSQAKGAEGRTSFRSSSSFSFGTTSKPIGSTTTPAACGGSCKVGDILPVPKSQFWPQLTQRWEAAQQKLNESIKAVDLDVDAANAKFQDLYHANYVKWINQADSP